MTLNDILITIYIPTKNRCDLLKRAIDSVLIQSYQNFELIIVDDASTDETQAYLAYLQQQDSRIRFFSNASSKGACFSRNLAIKSAQGYFVTGLDDDDEFLPHRLQSFIDNYDEKYAFLCAGFYWRAHAHDKKVHQQAKIIDLDEMLDYNQASNQVFVERERLLEIGGFDENFVACQDYDTWVRLMLKFGKARRIAEISYIVHRDANLERITEPTNWLKGHEQFMIKHKALMSESNIHNQSLNVLITSGKRFPFNAYLKSIKFGYFYKKTRYLCVSNIRHLLK